MSTYTTCEPILRPRKIVVVPPEEEIVISGIAGRFPESDNVQKLHNNLISKMDLVTDDDRRWKLDNPEVPQRTGKINRIEKFDALFFGVHSKQAHAMDPMCRMLLEHVYEAVIDAGVNPKMIRGTRTGVFIGACFSESEKTLLYEERQVNGFGITGCARSMLANRISYWLGITGPSYTIDTACSSSLYAMEHAYKAIRDGQCDAAIVGGANLCLHPYVSMQFFKLGGQRLCAQRIASCAVVFLQKAKDAKRIYATFVHAKTNCDGFKEQGITFPSNHMQSILLDEFCHDCGVSPLNISYIEAHGTGTKVGDPEEVNAIDKILGKNRTKDSPLLIGSVKSNLGHTEPVSGLVSIIKVILAMETGILQPNINFKNARQEIKAFAEKRIRVVTDPTPWKGGYAGINSFGFGGANCHILLKSHVKEKVNNGTSNDTLPRLVAISGRSDDAVLAILKDLESKPVDIEYVSLLHDIHSEDINGHLYRGYTILPPRGVPDTPIRDVKSASGAQRPIWFVFSGMGSQWPGMGEALLRIPIFLEAIKKCETVLKPHGIDVFHIITNKDKTAFDNVLNSFVGIAAVQIGLVDVLHSIGIKADNIIGHSVGELGSAYADGCLTAEQMIMSVYLRGLACVETNIIQGSMAAVGLGYQSLKDMCPPDIEVACHNAPENATISGPAESMKNFVAKLQEKNIFTREVSCNNIPYHSRYIAPVGSKLLAYLKEVIPDPKPRSSKWLSTSVPISKWDTPAACFSSAEYHTNNLLNPVLFEETSALIPKDAVVVEIAPHGLLQAILRRSLNPGVTNIPLTQRAHRDNVQVFLQALGKMFNIGLHPQLANLYPSVKYPVSRTTQMISPLIKWEHANDWYVSSYKSQQKITSGGRVVKVGLSDNSHEFLAGHIIDGRILFPATGYLVLIWETLGMMHGKLYTEISVVFEDVKFIRATTVPKDKDIEFTLMIQKGTGRFEVVEGGACVATGIVRMSTNPAANKINTKIFVNNEEETMTSHDIYKELKLRGYHYTGLFRSITRSTINGSKGHILWNNNWVAFMDNMLQMQILGKDTRGLFVPTRIKKLTIDIAAHFGKLRFKESEKEFPVLFSTLHKVIVSGGVEIRGLKVSEIFRRKPVNDPVLEEYKFVSFTDRAEVSLREIAKLSTHTSVENHSGVKVKMIEFIEEADQISYNDLISPWISETFRNMPLFEANISIISTEHKFKDIPLPSNVSVVDRQKMKAEANALLIIGHRLLTNNRAGNLSLLLLELKQGGFVLTRENIDDIKNVEQVAQAKGFYVILEKKCERGLFVLLKKQEKLGEKTLVIRVNNETFDWVEKMRKTMSKELENETAGNTRIFFVGQGDFENGLMGLIKCLRKERGGEMVRGILIQDSKAPAFSLLNPLYFDQVKKDLSVCVLRENGVWGTYRYLNLPQLKPKPVRHMWLNQIIRGDLSSFTWIEGPIQLGYKTEDLINIVYSSINFKDVMLATGKLVPESVATTRQTQECVIGLEYCGIDLSGKRIMGMLESRCMANICIADRELAWEVPDSWSLEEAATVPVAYGTCYYGLYL